MTTEFWQRQLEIKKTIDDGICDVSHCTCDDCAPYRGGEMFWSFKHQGLIVAVPDDPPPKQVPLTAVLSIAEVIKKAAGG